MRLAYLVFPIPAISRNGWQPDQKRVKVEHPEKTRCTDSWGNHLRYNWGNNFKKENVGRSQDVPQMESLNHTSTTFFVYETEYTLVIIQAHKCATTNTH